jgi:hypothetical protein
MQAPEHCFPIAAAEGFASRGIYMASTMTVEQWQLFPGWLACFTVDRLPRCFWV